MATTNTQYPSASTSQPSAGYIPSLDGIRALSFLIVFLAHAGLERWIPGYFGLTVFFFLSGYLITTLLRIEFEQTGTINLRQFYLRRALRIFPPFYLVLVGASALTLIGALEGTLQPRAVMLQLLHWSNYEIIRYGWWEGRAPGTWVYWSLAVEEHFYVAFPLVYLHLRHRLPSARQQVLVLSAICAAVLVWRCMLVFGFDAPKDRLYVATDTRIDSILFGCIFAIYGNPALDDRTRDGGRWLSVSWVLLGVVLLLVSLVVRVPQFDQTLRYTLQGIALVPLFTIAIRYHDRGIVRLLNARWLKRIGVLSYGLYLVHTSVIYGVQQWTDWHPAIQGVLAFGLSFLLASTIYHIVEQPSARLRKRLAQHWTPPHQALSDATPTPSATHAGTTLVESQDTRLPSHA
jgi:peptidoglycan/LPS O-acetylase OafA/YrhL